MEKHTLIITEKPNAAARIAHALDINGNAEKITEKGISFYSARRNKKIVIVPALGHLYTVDSGKKDRSSYPILDYSWVPLHVATKRAKRSHTCITIISMLAKNADAFIDACDNDIEGSIIGYNILRYACEGKEKVAKRMKYSTLTKGEIEKSYFEALPTLNFCLIEAGLTRHEVDWLYGINLSRALTKAVKNFSGQYATLSTGRVQGPTLRFIATRERNIRSFVPTPYWSIETHVSLNGLTAKVDYEKRAIYVRDEAEHVVKACEGKKGKIETIETSSIQQMPLPPFDLGTLQNEAYRLFKYTPVQTSTAAQRLYLDALISYPRTDSQKLPPAIGYKTILEHLLKNREHGRLAAELLAKPILEPTEGKGEDPAHPAIYPTGNLPERTLNNTERTIWALILRRFMASFGDPATLQEVEARINIEGYKFHNRGIQTLREGWTRYYKPFMPSVDKVLPPMKEGEEVTVKKITVEDRLTQPPLRYNPSTILKKMQKEGIGTKATRAGIIQTLYNRRFICGERIEVTDLGFEVFDVLSRNCSSVMSPELTRALEEKMRSIQEENETKEDIVKEAKSIITTMARKLKEKERTIGEQLSYALEKMHREKPAVGACPTCKNGKLLVVRSKKTGKQFIGCTGYFEGECKTAFPLPQLGIAKTSGVCHVCGWPTVLIATKGKRPWRLCLSPNCPKKKQEGSKK